MHRLALLVLVVGAVSQDQDPDKFKKPEGLAKVGLTADQVNKAIDRGAAFLAAKYGRKTELSGDNDYLAAYALIHTGVYNSDPELKEKIGRFLRGAGWLKSGHRSYVAGLRALALEASGDPELRALTWECAQYLLEAQGPKGTWDYKVDVDIGVKEAEKKEEPGVTVTGGESLDEEPKGRELSRKTPWEKGNDGDNSCTQFALLGLHAAAKSGYKIPREAWERCLKTMEERWNKEDGGWGYTTGGSYGSMTAAGVCSLALCRHYLGEKEYLKSDKLQAGLKWLSTNFAVDKNPKKTDWALYYLYSIERTGVFTNSEFIGDHEWYPLGARRLVDTQKENGQWEEYTDVVGTSLALLFLTRATAPVTKEIKRGGKGWLETHARNEHQNFHFILDCSGSMMARMEDRTKFDVARQVVEHVITQLPEGAHVGRRAYGHRRRAIDKEADTDSELVIPAAPIQKKDFIARLKALKCRGKTPITHSLLETIGDLAKLDPEVEIAVILLTDGLESTPGAKPDEAAAKLASARKGLKLHVVGFDIDDQEKAALEKIAAAGGGRYFHAKKAADLMEALSFATLGNAGYLLKDRAGKEVVQGRLGDRHELPEGKYLFVYEKDERVVWINTEATTHVTVNLLRYLKK